MQKSALKEQLRQQLNDLKKAIASFEEQENHGAESADHLIKETESLYRKLAVYQHLLKSTTAASGLDVHMRIIQAVEKKEEVKIEVKVPKEEIQIRPDLPEAISTNDEKKITEKPQPETGTIQVKKIELGINDKYRIINELFGQHQGEFNAALQQLNAIETWSSAETYLNSLRSVYDWKENNALVKTFYSLVQKRFA